MTKANALSYMYSPVTLSYKSSTKQRNNNKLTPAQMHCSVNKKEIDHRTLLTFQTKYFNFRCFLQFLTYELSMSISLPQFFPGKLIFARLCVLKVSQVLSFFLTSLDDVENWQSDFSSLGHVTKKINCQIPPACCGNGQFESKVIDCWQKL